MSESDCKHCGYITDWTQRDVDGGTIYQCDRCGREEVIVDETDELAMLRDERDEARERQLQLLSFIQQQTDELEEALRERDEAREAARVFYRMVWSLAYESRIAEVSPEAVDELLQRWQWLDGEK